MCELGWHRTGMGTKWKKKGHRIAIITVLVVEVPSRGTHPAPTHMGCILIQFEAQTHVEALK